MTTKELPTERWRQIVINFVPGWFLVTMGTGITGVLIHSVDLGPSNTWWQDDVSSAFLALNCLLWGGFAAISVLRYALYPWVWTRMIRHPMQSMFLGAVPMGLNTIVNMLAGAGYARFAWCLDAAWALWWVSVILCVAILILVPYEVFRHTSISLESLTAVILVPIVPAVVCAASGGVVLAPLIAEGSVNDAIVTIMISWILWGIGIAVSFIFIAIYMLRLSLHKLPPQAVIVSAFLPVGPMGQGAFGIIGLGAAAKQLAPTYLMPAIPFAGDAIYAVSVVVGLLLWGCGAFFLIHGVLSVVSRFREPGVAFNLGWWGCTFPLGVWIAATISLGRTLPSAFFRILSYIFLLALIALWAAVSSLTVYQAWRGTLFFAPCLSDITGANAAAAKGAGSAAVAAPSSGTVPAAEGATADTARTAAEPTAIAVVDTETREAQSTAA